MSWRLVNRYFEHVRAIKLAITVADLRGGTRDAPPGWNSFIFMQFSGKNWLNNRFVPTPWKLAPPVWEILDPPLNYRQWWISFVVPGVSVNPLWLVSVKMIGQFSFRSFLLNPRWCAGKERTTVPLHYGIMGYVLPCGRTDTTENTAFPQLRTQVINLWIDMSWLFIA